MRETSPILKWSVFLAVLLATFSLLYRPPRGAPPTEPEVVELPPVVHLPRYGQVPDFHLAEADRSALDRQRLLGKVWVASFVFTTCAATCPILASRIQMLQGVLPDGVLQVSISVDPDRDDPDTLAKWGRRYQRDPKRWLLGTGDFLEIRKLMIEGLGLEDEEDPLLHSNGFVLIDRAAAIRGYYDAMKPEAMGALVRDVNLVLTEGQARP